MQFTTLFAFVATIMTAAASNPHNGVNHQHVHKMARQPDVNVVAGADGTTTYTTTYTTTRTLVVCTDTATTSSSMAVGSSPPYPVGSGNGTVLSYPTASAPYSYPSSSIVPANPNAASQLSGGVLPWIAAGAAIAAIVV